VKSANFLEDGYLANAIGYAEHLRRSHYAVIRVSDDAGNWPKGTNTRAISKSVKAGLLSCSLLADTSLYGTEIDEKIPSNSS
jgi:hypothetical protein